MLTLAEMLSGNEYLVYTSTSETGFTRPSEEIVTGSFGKYGTHDDQATSYHQQTKRSPTPTDVEERTILDTPASLKPHHRALRLNSVQGDCQSDIVEAVSDNEAPKEDKDEEQITGEDKLMDNDKQSDNSISDSNSCHSSGPPLSSTTNQSSTMADENAVITQPRSSSAEDNDGTSWRASHIHDRVLENKIGGNMEKLRVDDDNDFSVNEDDDNPGDKESEVHGSDEDEGVDDDDSLTGNDEVADRCKDNDNIKHQEDVRGGDSEDEVELTRADWVPLRKIPNYSFIKVLTHYIEGTDEVHEEHYEFLHEFEGGFKLFSGDRAGTYVVKIPSVGTAARWQKQDAYMLRSEFDTMKLIRESMKCPVPGVLAYSDTLDNDSGAPFHHHESLFWS